MCGRYSLTVDQEALQVALGVEGLLHPRPRYNVAPGQEVPAVVMGEEGPEGALLRWGLVPSWASDPSIGNRLINARSETAHRKPAFREAFRAGRCLIPVDGFYEWRAAPAQPSGAGRRSPGAEHPSPGAGRRSPGRKRPYRVRLADEEVFTLAGLRERWVAPDGEALRTFTILTTDANERLRPIHDRMPVIVPAEARSRWLAPETEPAELKRMLGPPADEHILIEEVSPRVNSVAHDDPSCLEPPATEEDRPPEAAEPRRPEAQRDLFGDAGGA